MKLILIFLLLACVETQAQLSLTSSTNAPLTIVCNPAAPLTITATNGYQPDYLSGLLYWFRLLEGTGNTSADSSGNSGTSPINLHGVGTYTTWTTGPFGNAISCDGTTSSYGTTGIGVSGGPTSLTVTAWVNYGSFANGYNTAVGADGNPSGANGSWALNFTTGGKFNPSVPVSAGQVTYASGSHTLLTGVWYFIAITYDSTNGLIGYVNAQSDGTAAANGNAASDDAVIYVSRDQWWGFSSTLTFGQLRYYNHALTSSQITTVYNARY